MFFVSTSTCCKGPSYSLINPKMKEVRVKIIGKVRMGSIVGDVTLSISALVIGILALVGAIKGVPPAASYTLLGVSGAIALSWIVMAYRTKLKVFRQAADLLNKAVFWHIKSDF